ncbi:MAG: carbohydrate ABC transporter substrate-binding protein [Spirochaetales bacterium]|nr:carbohydrate ABC transporter substrate-binding protein [Spirochaetales bacterium]
MMKKGLMIFLFLIVSSVLVFAGGQNDASSDTIKLKYQVWITPNLTRDFYDGAVAAFNVKFPDVEVEIIELSATASSGASDFIRNRIAAGDVPDVMSNLSDIVSFSDAGHLWAMPTDDPDLARVKDIMSVAYKGKIYKLPQSVQPQSNMFYNKDLWAKSGLTENDIPKTMEEFDKVCAKIKAAGYTPILTGGEWVPLIVWEYFIGPEITKNYPNFWTDVYAGKIKWTDPEIMNMVRILDSGVKKGYFNEGALSIGYAQLEQEFLNGNGVMYPMGSWFTAAEAAADKTWETGVFAIPTLDGETNLMISGGYGSSAAVSSASKNPEIAFELVKFMVLDEVYGSKFIQADGLYSNLDPPLMYEMTQLQQDLADLAAGADYTRSMFTHVLGEAAPPGLDVFLRKGAEAILSQSYKSLEDLCQQIDDFVAETR